MNAQLASHLLLLAKRRVSRETIVHDAADRFLKPMIVAVMYAFMKGRKAGKKAPGVVRAALLESLPPVLLKVVAAGGEAGLKLLGSKLKTAAFNEDEPRDDRGRWTNDPSGDRSTWEPNKGGTLYHGTEKSPKETAVYGVIKDQPMFLTTEYEEAHAYANQVHRSGAKSTGEEHVLKMIAKPGKTLDVDKKVAKALENGKDPEKVAIDAGRAAKADYVTYNHPSGVDGKKEEQHVVIALNPRKSLSYEKAWKAKSHRALRTAADHIKMKFDVSNPNAIAWAKEHAAELAKGISDTTRDNIERAITLALETGEDPEDAIFDAVGDEARAEMIARTEIMRAANEGQRESWDQAVEKGLLTGDEKREWIATEDACPLCEELDGELADLDGAYPGDGGDGPPLHPNCRCTEGISA